MQVIIGPGLLAEHFAFMRNFIEIRKLSLHEVKSCNQGIEDIHSYWRFEILSDPSRNLPYYFISTFLNFSGFSI